MSTADFLNNNSNSDTKSTILSKLQSVALPIGAVAFALTGILSIGYGGAYIGTHYDIVSGHVGDVSALGGPNQNITFTPNKNTNNSTSVDTSAGNSSTRAVNVSTNDTSKQVGVFNVSQFKTDADGFPISGSTVKVKSGTWKVTNVGPSTPLSYYARFGDNVCKVSKAEYNKLSKAYDNDAIVDPMICHRA